MKLYLKLFINIFGQKVIAQSIAIFQFNGNGNFITANLFVACLFAV